MNFFSYILIICLAIQAPLSYATIESTQLADNATIIATESETANNTAQDSVSNPTQNNLSPRFKDFINAVLKKLKYIFAPEHQKYIVGALTGSEIIDILWTSAEISATKQPLKNIPPVLNKILKDAYYNFNYKISTSESMGFGAAANAADEIVIGQELLDTCSPKELRFVMGHEIAHITQHHHKKYFIFLVLLIFGSGFINKSINELVDYLQKKYQLNNTTKVGKIVAACGKINRFIFSNPLIVYILFKLINSKINRTFEKEADLVSAIKLNSAQGGIKVFERYNNMYYNMYTNPPSSSLPWFYKWLNPFYIVRRINDLPWFSSHPSIEERIAYLKQNI